MLRVTILSAWLVIASGTRLGLDGGRLGLPLEVGSGDNRKLIFPNSLQQKNTAVEMMMATPQEMEDVADDLHEEHNAGLSSFLEIDSHESFQKFGDAYMKAMDPYMKAAAKKLVNGENGLGQMFEDHMLFEVNDYESKKAWRAFHDMDTNDDGKITKEEIQAYTDA